ncbi:hypothetical protein L3X38_018514 [Prunus dulcis]|uniref:Uncharacterized protein n=1 Tax=Prunus dulcis TaxID=3755 RepID=A0AAD4WBV6_PRUDU|nr:hypothetical protein L3X38_018514 [Prunus dulcis]
MPAGQALLHKSAKATLRFKCSVAAVLWPVETPEWISYVLSSIPEHQNVLLQFSADATSDCSLKIFVPMTVLALFILIPVNVSSGTLFFPRKELVLTFERH